MSSGGGGGPRTTGLNTEYNDTVREDNPKPLIFIPAGLLNAGVRVPTNSRTRDQNQTHILTKICVCTFFV